MFASIVVVPDACAHARAITGDIFSIPILMDATILVAFMILGFSSRYLFYSFMPRDSATQLSGGAQKMVASNFDGAGITSESVGVGPMRPTHGVGESGLPADSVESMEPVVPCLAVASPLGKAQAGAKADLDKYRALIALSVRSNDMLQASELFRSLVDAGYEPGVSEYALMIRGYCATGYHEEAVKLFRSMRWHGITYDASLVNVILQNCARMNNLQVVDEILADIEALNVFPSNQTLVALIRFFGRTRDFARALDVFEYLPKRFGFQIQADAFICYISVCLSNGRLDLAMDALHKMKRAGYAANVRTYESLIHSSLRHGDVDTAVSLVEDAFGLANNNNKASFTSRVQIDPKLVESVLLLICRRRQAKRLGVPLVQGFQLAGLDICPEHLVESIFRSADTQSELPHSHFESRRAVMQSWRNFAVSL